MPSVQRILQLAPVCCYLAANYKVKNTLWSGMPKSARSQSTLIYIYWKILNKIYTLDNDYPGLDAPAQYLWELCQKFGFRAAQIVDGGGGGQVVPITPSGGSNIMQLDWLVSDTASGTAPLANGESFVTLNGTGGMPDFRGFNINFFRGGVTQNTTPLGDGSTYYYWNKVSGLFQLFPSAAYSGELMRISPDIVGGLTLENFNQPQVVFMSSDDTYTLATGYLISRIAIKPTAADSVKIGTTLGGDEIMFEKTMTPNVYTGNGVSLVDDSAMADGAPMTIYFTGFTSQAQINIYLLPI